METLYVILSVLAYLAAGLLVTKLFFISLKITYDEDRPDDLWGALVVATVWPLVVFFAVLVLTFSYIFKRIL